MYKRNKNIIAAFECECGNNLTTKNTRGIRCPLCGRLYEVTITECEHDRIWINDILSPLQMLRVEDDLKEEIAELIKKRLLTPK